LHFDQRTEGARWRGHYSIQVLIGETLRAARERVKE
jgi:hypothetical protein